MAASDSGGWSRVPFFWVGCPERLCLWDTRELGRLESGFQVFNHCGSCIVDAAKAADILRNLLRARAAISRVSVAWLRFARASDGVLRTWHSFVFELPAGPTAKALPDRISALRRYASAVEACRALMATESPTPAATFGPPMSQMSEALRVGHCDWCFQLFCSELHIDVGDPVTAAAIKRSAGVPARSVAWEFGDGDWPRGVCHARVKSFGMWAEEFLRSLGSATSECQGGLPKSLVDVEQEGDDAADSWVAELGERDIGLGKRRWRYAEEHKRASTEIFD